MTKTTSGWSWVPRQEWEWYKDQTIYGVHTYEGQLVWWERPDGPGGYVAEVASVQSFQDFLAAGAPVPAPEEVSEALQTLLIRPK